MVSFNPLSWWRTFLRWPNSRPSKAIGITVLIALLCSAAVSITAVLLQPRIDTNRLEHSAASLIEILDILGAPAPRTRLVELQSGAYVRRDPGTWTALDKAVDFAGLGKRETMATVYEVYSEGKLQFVILPVRGQGYQSTLKGYLALKGDLNTVAAVLFHEQNETPGLGARIEEREWQTLWQDKHILDEAGIIRLKVAKGKGSGPFEVDGITGATRTGSGVTGLIQFWLGENGYGPYLERLRREARP